MPPCSCRAAFRLTSLVSVSNHTTTQPPIHPPTHPLQFCATNDDESCVYDHAALWIITCVGLGGLIALRQLNYTVWGPLFAVSLDFQCELVLDTSLRFGTNKEVRGGGMVR